MIAEGAEAGMLGLYLTNPEAWSRWPTTVADYADQRHLDLFVAMNQLTSRGLPLDLSTVMGELRRCGSQIVGSFVGQIAEDAPGTGLGIVTDLAEARQRRAMILTAERLKAAALDPTTELLAAFEEAMADGHRLIRTASRADAPELIEHQLAWTRQLEDGLDKDRPITTGFRDLDHVLDRLPRGELTIVAARPGVGKSALVGQVARHNAARGAHVLFCSAEMTARQLVERWESQQAGVPLERIRKGVLSADERRAVIQPLAGAQMRICDQAAMTSQTVVDVASRVAAGKPLDLVIVDHLHHLSDRPDGESRYEQVGRMVNRLKALAKAQQCVVLAVCQLNRQAAEGRATMAHLRDAGTLEEYANVILLLHPAPKDSKLYEVSIEKHRNGPVGTVELVWDGSQTAFRNAEWRSP